MGRSRKKKAKDECTATPQDIILTPFGKRLLDKYLDTHPECRVTEMALVSPPVTQMHSDDGVIFLGWVYVRLNVGSWAIDTPSIPLMIDDGPRPLRFTVATSQQLKNNASSIQRTNRTKTV